MPRTPTVNVDTPALVNAAKQLADLANGYDPTLQMLDDYAGGYPASTPGAAPATTSAPPPDHDPERCLTQIWTSRLGGYTFCQNLIPCKLHPRAIPPASGAHVLGEIETASGRKIPHVAKPQPGSKAPTPRQTPVEQLALNPHSDDALAAAAILDKLAGDVVRAVAALADGMQRWPRPQAGIGKLADGIHCTQHLKIGLFFKIARHGLCRYCDDFRAEQHRIPSVVLLQHRHQGVTITPQMRANDHPARRITRTGRKKAAPMHKCPYPKCDTQIPDSQYACRPHWFQLPTSIRTAITRAWSRINNGHLDAVDEHDTATAAARAHWKTAA